MKIEKEQIDIIEFGRNYSGLTNDALFEKVYTDKEVASKNIISMFSHIR